MRRQRRVRVWAGVLAAVLLGIGAAELGPGWSEPLLWAPDLLVGWTCLAAGAVAWRVHGSPATGGLLAAVGATWFLGFSGVTLYVHRGPLVHLLLTHPGWRPRTQLDRAGVATGYVAALVPSLWGNDVGAVVLAVALLAVTLRGLSVPGRARWERRPATVAACALVAVLVLGVLVRQATPGRIAVLPALLAYEAVLCAIAIGLAVRVPRPSAVDVADLVVELGQDRSGTLRARLARALGDPGLQIGYWSQDGQAYLDDLGRRVDVPVDGGSRRATVVDRGAEPFAVLVHDPQVLTAPDLVDAVAAATRLAVSNIDLQARVERQLTDLAASRRRLLIAADEERRLLARRVETGPERRLQALATTIAEVPPDAGSPGLTDHLSRAADSLDQSLAELRALASGLHPPGLVASGLADALTALADRSPVPVRLHVAAGRLPPSIETAVWFLCAEALANASKHARATAVELSVVRDEEGVTVVIADDGVGSAEISRGTGLQGIADRVDALGGALRVDSRPQHGTRVRAELPLVPDPGA